MTILPMLSLRLWREIFFEGDDVADDDDVAATVAVDASSEESVGVVSSSTGVVGETGGAIYKLKIASLVCLFRPI